ncbi:MAG: class I SAM-dependent methyltransferase [Candidatus Berkelbacteria bacterium]|nr:class I SAM-dependent methyltransferase [Candidatus Berkelbacteria bacterium]
MNKNNKLLRLKRASVRALNDAIKSLILLPGIKQKNKIIHRSKRVPLLIKNIKRCGTLLDVGCGGIEHTTFDLVCATGNYHLIVGVDAHKRNIDERKIWAASRRDNSRYRFINTKAQDLRLDQTFDVIFLSHVLEHLTLNESKKLIDYLWKSCSEQMIIETPDQFESGRNAVNEYKNPYQKHKCLIDQKLMSGKGFKKIFTYFQESGYSNSVYKRDRGIVSDSSMTAKKPDGRSMKKINIGCGPYKLDGYINIDKNSIWKPDKVLDVREGLTYPNNSVDEIRAWHFIEHLDKDEIISFLALCYKKLKKRGKLDLLFPVGITYDLDHKSFLDKRSFDQVTGSGSEDSRDEYCFGPRIAFRIISEERSRNKFCKMLRLILEVKK